MGLIAKILGGPRAVTEIGAAIESVAEVFTPNATRKMTVSHEAFIAALGQFGLEFQSPQPGWFDALINGLNRLPRPALALGTLGLFVYAMAAPESFAQRMTGLALVPEPLWWLLGAVVSFYFGAREMFHARQTGPAMTLAPPKPEQSDNPALSEWQGSAQR